MQTEKKVKLICPLTLPDGTVLSEVIIGRPKAKHLRSLPEDAFSQQGSNPTKFLPLFKAMLGLSDEILDEIDIADLLEMVSAINDFLDTSRPTG